MLNFFRRKAASQHTKRQPSQSLPDAVKRGWIPVADLRAGMMVTELDRPWEETPFLFQRFTVNTPAEIAQVQRICERVHVEYRKDQLRRQLRPPPASLGQMAKDIDTVGNVFDRARQSTSELFNELRLTNSLNAQEVSEVVDDCVDQVLHNRDAAAWLNHIREHSAGLAEHALGCMTVAVIIGSEDNLLRSELRDLATCALLHDVGKTRLPTPTTPAHRLQGEELAHYRSHVNHGRDILLSSRELYAGAADVAFSHHERVDGSGFPRGLDAERIPRYAKIVAIANRYNHLLHPDDEEPCPPTRALRQLYAERDTALDAVLVDRLIAAIGVYPPGSIVEMDNGEVALVLASNPLDRLNPRIIIVLDSDKQAARQRVLDLSLQPGDDAGRRYAIGCGLADGSYGIQLEDFLRAGLRIEGSAPDQ